MKCKHGRKPFSMFLLEEQSRVSGHDRYTVKLKYAFSFAGTENYFYRKFRFLSSCVLCNYLIRSNILVLIIKGLMLIKKIPFYFRTNIFRMRLKFKDLFYYSNNDQSNCKHRLFLTFHKAHFTNPFYIIVRINPKILLFDK